MKILRLALVAVTACTLAACFDLDQKVSINRSGSGQYQMSIAAKGPFGDAMKADKKNDLLKPMKAQVTTEIRGDGSVVKTAKVDFKSISELKLKDEQVSLQVLGHSWFGLGPAQVRFKRSFSVGDARAAQGGPNAKDEEAGKAMLAGVFGDHTYTFSVTLPGSIERIAPVKVKGVEIKPEVTGDFYNGHTITWRMPLMTLFDADKLTYEVDFSAYGSFADARSQKSSGN